MGRPYRSLIVFLNRRCPVGCASCNVRATPDNPEALSVDWLRRFFRDTAPDLPRYITWTGGEPFLSIETLLEGVSLASRRGHCSEILTSGTWFGTHPEYLDRLATVAGPVSLRLSLDAEHGKTVPVPLIIDLIRQAGTLGMDMGFTLRKIPGQDDTTDGTDDSTAAGYPEGVMEAIKTALPDYYRRNHRRSRWLHVIPHIPVEPGDHPPGGRKQQYKKPCSMIFRDLVIGADGLVYPCCGFFGFGFRRRLAVGDPMREPLERLGADRPDRPLLRDLKDKGPYGICTGLGLEPEQWAGWGFEIPCHLCMALFSREGKRLVGGN